MIHTQDISDFIVPICKSIFMHKTLAGCILDVKIILEQTSCDFNIILLKIIGKFCGKYIKNLL